MYMLIAKYAIMNVLFLVSAFNGVWAHVTVKHVSIFIDEVRKVIIICIVFHKIK